MEKWMSKMDDIHTHLNDMDLSYEFLSGMGVTIYDEDYVSWCSCPSLIVTLLTWKPSQTPPLVVGIHSPLKTSSPKLLSFQTSDSCRPTQPQVGPENFHFSVIGVPQQREEKQLT